jgi:hypothetical protein
VILVIEPRVPVKSSLYLERLLEEQFDVDNPVGFKDVWLLNDPDREAVRLTGSSLFSQPVAVKMVAAWTIALTQRPSLPFPSLG